MKKLKVFAKVIAMVMTVLLVFQIIPSTLVSGVAKDIELVKRMAEAVPITEVSQPPAEIMEETEEKKDAFTKTFTREDGTMVDIISSEPVHFYKDGEWKDIDNTLVNRTVDGKAVLQNKSNNFTATLPQKIEKDSYISIENGESKVSFKLNGVSTQKDSRIMALDESLLSEEDTMMSVKDNVSTVRYSDVLGTADVEYLVTETGIKENIILDTVPSKGYFVSFTFTSPGMTWNVNKDKSISFFNEKSEEVFTMQAPYMFDASGTVSEDVEVEVYRSREGNIIKYTPSFEWLSDKNRVYPVTVDPSFTTNNRGFLITANAGNCDGEVGSYVYVQDFEKDGTAYNSQALLNLVYSRLQDEILISSASVRLRCEPLSTGGDFTNTIGISLANEPWAEETTSVIPQSSSDYLDAHTITEAAFYEFDITEAFNMWSMGLCDKNGLVVKPILGEGESCNVRVGGEDGYSVNRPYYTVNYRNVYGIRDDFEYHSIDMGRAGTAYVNDVTNALVVVREELGLAGNVMPVNLCRIYDSELNNSVEYSLPIGNGAGTNWQWNYYGRLVYSSEKLRYYGADGTWMYFVLEETLEDGKQKYVCPDSDKFPLWVESDASSLKDFENMYFEDEEYTYRFNSTGRIIKIIQKSSNASIDITYIASATIGKVTDGVGREFRLSVQVPSNSPRKTSKIGAYTSSGEQITVTTPGSETPTNIEMTYTYDTSVAGVTLFKTATYADGETVRYEYNDNNDLVLIENIDGSRLEIEYTNGRVSAYTKRVYDTVTQQYLFDERVEFQMISPYEHVFTTYDGDESTPIYTETVYYNKNFEIERRLNSEGKGSGEYFYNNGERKAFVNIEEGTNLLASQEFTGALVVDGIKLAPYNSRPIEGAIGEQVYRVDFSPFEPRRVYKRINVKSFTTGENSVTFNAELWVKTHNAAHLHGDRNSAILMEAINSERVVTGSVVYAINTAITDWQFVPCCITVPAGTEYVNCYIVNDSQVSSLFFADASFYKSNFSLNYVDTHIVNANSADTDFDLCSCGQECNYGKDCFCACSNIDECNCVSCKAISYKSHNDLGQLVASYNTDGKTSITESFTYSDDGNYLESASNSLGKTINYEFDSQNGTLSSLVDSEGVAVDYAYNAMLQLAEISQAIYGDDTSLDCNAAANSFEYSNDKLSSISTPNGVEYRFTYDAFGNQKRIMIGDQTLSSYSYGTGKNNDRVSSVTYGNGQIVHYSYDADGNVTAIENDSTHSGYEYVYSYYNGELVSVTDRKTGFVTFFGDSSYSVKDSSNNIVYQSNYDEDENFIETVGGNSFTYNYTDQGTYDPISGETTSSFFVECEDDVITQEKIQDYYGRTVNTVTRFNDWNDNSGITTSYEYVSDGDNTSKLVKSIYTTVKVNGGYRFATPQEYEYDENGNITSESVTNSTDITGYWYDEAGRLYQAVNNTYDTYTEYDNGGNVTYKYVIWEDYANELTREEVLNFEYANENWPDLLTSVNNVPITYDEIGNLLSYNGTTYSWTAGRQLASMTSANKSIAFKYNDSGLRTHKSVTENGTTKTYMYSWAKDGKLISQSDGTTTLYFIYDMNEDIIGFAKATGSSIEMFYYVKSLLGDVNTIIDSSGSPVVYYTYDAWGYLIGVTGSQANSLGVLNPIRYRSYYYDTETGYYYLQSRYYDPLWGRFINADEYITVSNEIQDTNLFIYASDNPIRFVDYNGKASSVNSMLSFVEKILKLFYPIMKAVTEKNWDGTDESFIDILDLINSALEKIGYDFVDSSGLSFDCTPYESGVVRVIAEYANAKIKNNSAPTDTYIVELYYGKCPEWGEEIYDYRNNLGKMEVFLALTSIAASALSKPLGAILAVIDIGMIFVDDPHENMIIDMIVISSEDREKNYSCVLHITAKSSASYIYTYEGKGG